MMSDPQRVSLLDVVQKSLNYANKKSFIHRVIYLISCEVQPANTWINSLEHSVKTANEERGCGVGKWDPLACLALSSSKYVIAVFEGTEDVYNKHTILFRQRLEEQSQPIRDVHVLAYIPHINKRWLIGWTSTTVKLPVALNFTSEPIEPERNATLVLHLIQDLYYVLKFVNEIPMAEFRQRLGTLSTSCGQFLPSVNLLDALFESPLLTPLEETFDDVLPNYLPDQERVWPAPLFR